MSESDLGTAPIPSRFRGPGRPAIDEIVATTWDSLRPIARELNDYHRNRLVNATGNFLPALHAAGLLGSGLSWLEVGSGVGMKSLPISANVGSYVAVELDASQSQRARELAGLGGLDTVQYVSANASDVARQPQRYDVPVSIDVLLLYAVLEHLLPEERASLFELAAEVLALGGAVVVMETPNRLIPFDSHTSQLHFFNMLPDDLAIEYVRRSERAEIREPLLAADPDERRRLLYRFGRGLSYHDFELGLDLDAASSLPLAFDGFDVHLLNQEPLTRQEVSLCRYFSDNGLAVPPAFGRSWIELAAGAPGRGSAAASRWTPPSDGQFELWAESSFWSLDAYRAGPGGRVVFSQLARRTATVTVLLNVATSEGEIEARDEAGQVVTTFEIAALQAGRTPTWHDHVAVEIQLDGSVLELVPIGASVIHNYGLLI